MFLSLLLSTALAADGARDTLHYRNATYLRINPLGLIDSAHLGWKRRLSDSDSLLLSDTHTYLAAKAVGTPAWGRFGLYAEAQPLAIIKVFGDLMGVAYVGNFDQVMSFPDSDATYSDQTLSDLGDQGRNEPRAGWVATGGVTLRAKAGPIAIRTTAQFRRYQLSLATGDQWFYDMFWDRLAPNGGLMYLNDSDLLYVGEKMRLGVRHTVSSTLTDAPVGEAAVVHHRTGPLFAWQFWDEKEGKQMQTPTMFVMAQWWMQHPYRTGQEQPAALPMMVAGFAFSGDLRSGA